MFVNQRLVVHEMWNQEKKAIEDDCRSNMLNLLSRYEYSLWVENLWRLSIQFEFQILEALSTLTMASLYGRERAKPDKPVLRLLMVIGPYPT